VNSHKQRIDEFLFDKFHSLSKMYLRGVFKAGNCEINGYKANSGVKLKTNDFVEIEVDLERETAMRPENVALDIVYEEAEFLIVNKPPEMLVHPTHRDKNGTLLNALSHYLNEKTLRERSADEQNPESRIPNPKSAIVRPGLIHRLDKKTSGLLLIAKTARAHRLLSDHFERRTVEKKYLALVEGIVEKDVGEIVAPIGRFEETKHWNIKEDGKYAETRFQVRERFADTTLLELQPVTGRTNQLRIHCEHIGHPIVGDEKRGGREFSRLCLHAFKLSFNHPTNHRKLVFEIDIPDGFIN
jgi:23S rRNA pseudouridine1911/1915/1917 synthase